MKHYMWLGAGILLLSLNALGSSRHKLVNCIGSVGLFAGNGQSECFWATTGQFRDWTGVNNRPPFDGMVPNYGEHLYFWGY